MRYGHGNRGVALITAMLIAALAAMVATDLGWDNTLDVRRTTVLLQRDQAMQIALGAESWVIGILHQDLQDTQTDHLGEIWAQELPGLPIDGGQVSGSIVDLQGRFNINNLIGESGEVQPEALEQFRRLLAALELDPKLAGVTADWLDADQEPQFPDGAEDAVYTAMMPPYRTPNRMLASVSELAALAGMTREMFDVLAPHITALPGRTILNANTATPAVLQSLDENLTASDVQSLLAERGDGGFADVQTAFSSLVGPDVVNSIGDATNYFQLQVTVEIGNVRVTLYSLLLRTPQGSVTPILRSFGTV